MTVGSWVPRSLPHCLPWATAPSSQPSTSVGSESRWLCWKISCTIPSSWWRKVTGELWGCLRHPLPGKTCPLAHQADADAAPLWSIHHGLIQFHLLSLLCCQDLLWTSAHPVPLVLACFPRCTCLHLYSGHVDTEAQNVCASRKNTVVMVLNNGSR
jgi:hypothetical protein